MSKGKIDNHSMPMCFALEWVEGRGRVTFIPVAGLLLAIENAHTPSCLRKRYEAEVSS